MSFFYSVVSVLQCLDVNLARLDGAELRESGKWTLAVVAVVVAAVERVSGDSCRPWRIIKRPPVSLADTWTATIGLLNWP